MSVFGRMFRSSGERLGTADAFASVALYAMAADGIVTEEETRGLETTLSRMELYRGLGTSDLEAMTQRLFGVMREHGPEALLERAYAALPEDLRETAFAVAVDLVMADRRIEDRERHALEALRKGLQVAPALAEQIELVLRIKNKV